MSDSAISAKSVPDRTREAKRLAILSAAAKIFNERGFHNTAMADVADALGVSKPFLYYYLKDKEDILAECSRTATLQLHAMLDDVRKADVSGWRKLEMAFRGYAEVMTTDFGICLIRSTAPGSLPPKSREKLWAFALFGAFNWITFWYQANGPMQPAAIADTFLDIFARGVVPPARQGKE
jgi:AcrR family transcriptional regulator